jgi:O-antigen ligase
MSLGVSLALLWQFYRHTDAYPNAWISNLGSPVFIVPNDVILLAVIAPLSVALLWGKQRFLLKILATASIATTTIMIVAFQSRGALLVMFVGTGLAVGLVRPRLGAVIGLATVIVVIIVDGLLGFPLLNKFGQNFSEWPPPRLSLWLAAWNMFIDAPLMGHGAHTYALLYQSYLDTVPTLPSRWAHNLYLEVLAEQGLLGLTALGSLLFSGGRLALRLRRVSQREVRVYGVGALSALVGLCIAGFYEASLLRLWVTVALFSVLGVVAFLSRAEAGFS